MKILFKMSIQKIIENTLINSGNEKYIAKINPEIDWEEITVDTVIKVPNVTPFKIENIKKDKGIIQIRSIWGLD